jgi:hypothetical protein
MLGQQIGVNLDVFNYLVGIPASWLLHLLLNLTGIA